MRRGEMITRLFPLVIDLTSLADSLILSQKYSGAIFPVTMKGFTVFAMLYISFVAKDNASRMQSSLLEIAEVQLILCKDSASREQNRRACLNVMPRRCLFYAKVIILFELCKTNNLNVFYFIYNIMWG